MSDPKSINQFAGCSDEKRESGRNIVVAGNKRKYVMTVEGSDITASTEVVYIQTIT